MQPVCCKPDQHIHHDGTKAADQHPHGRPRRRREPRPETAKQYQDAT
jgi:hypothetical protein